MSYIASVFPKNPDGTLKRKKPCQTTGCKSPHWHICLVKNDLSYKRVETPKAKKTMPASQRAAIAQAQRERHRLAREMNADRDEKIVKLYRDEVLGMSVVAQRLSLSQSTVNKVLARAQREGLLTIRPKGYTLSRPGTR